MQQGLLQFVQCDDLLLIDRFEALCFGGEDIKAVRKSIEALQAAPGKRWEKVVEKIILVAVGAVVAWLLARMGIK